MEEQRGTERDRGRNREGPRKEQRGTEGGTERDRGRNREGQRETQRETEGGTERDKGRNKVSRKSPRCLVRGVLVQKTRGRDR